MRELECLSACVSPCEFSDARLHIGFCLWSFWIVEGSGFRSSETHVCWIVVALVNYDPKNANDNPQLGRPANRKHISPKASLKQSKVVVVSCCVACALVCSGATVSSWRTRPRIFLKWRQLFRTLFSRMRMLLRGPWSGSGLTGSTPRLRWPIASPMLMFDFWFNVWVWQTICLNVPQLCMLAWAFSLHLTATSKVGLGAALPGALRTGWGWGLGLVWFCEAVWSFCSEFLNFLCFWMSDVWFSSACADVVSQLAALSWHICLPLFNLTKFPSSPTLYKLISLLSLKPFKAYKPYKPCKFQILYQPQNFDENLWTFPALTTFNVIPKPNALKPVETFKFQTLAQYSSCRPYWNKQLHALNNCTGFIFPFRFSNGLVKWCTDALEQPLRGLLRQTSKARVQLTPQTRSHINLET